MLRSPRNQDCLTKLLKTEYEHFLMYPVAKIDNLCPSSDYKKFTAYIVGGEDSRFAQQRFLFEIYFTPKYPRAVPYFKMISSNNRFETNTKLTIPEVWLPKKVNLSTMLNSFICFFHDRCLYPGVVYSDISGRESNNQARETTLFTGNQMPENHQMEIGGRQGTHQSRVTTRFTGNQMMSENYQTQIKFFERNDAASTITACMHPNGGQSESLRSAEQNQSGERKVGENCDDIGRSSDGDAMTGNNLNMTGNILMFLAGMFFMMCLLLLFDCVNE